MDSQKPTQPEAQRVVNEAAADQLSAGSGESDALDIASPNVDNQGVFRPPGILAGVGRMVLETGSVALPLRGLGRAFRAFSHLDYRYIWIGALLSNMGMWMQTVAMQWLIKSHAPGNTSALWLGREAFFQLIPSVLLLPLGGVLADRVDRRWIILAGNTFLALLALVLSQVVASGRVHMWELMGAATILGMWQAALVPANQSLLPSLVSKENLPNAVALNSMQFNLSRAIGPMVGGAVLVTLGAAWSFGFNSISYIFILVAILMIKAPATVTRKHEGILVAMAGGAKYLTGRKDILMILGVVFISSVLASPMRFMLAAIVEQMFDNTPAQFAKLLSSFGIGAVCGAGLLAMNSHKTVNPWIALVTMGLFGICEFLISFQSSFVMTWILVFLSGMTFIGSLNRLFAATISSIPNQVRGRVASFHVMSVMLGFPIGSLAAGRIATNYGITVVLFWFGLTLVFLLAIAGFIVWKFKIKYAAPDTADDMAMGKTQVV